MCDNYFNNDDPLANLDLFSNDSQQDAVMYAQDDALIMFFHDEKISYNNDACENSKQVEDCECECASGFMADMPTNESYTIIDDDEERDDENAEKFLREMGLLQKINDDEYFDLNFKSDSNSHNEIKAVERASVVGCDSTCAKDFKIFEDPFDDIEFNPANSLQEQLEKHPLPVVENMQPLCSPEFDNLSDICVDSETHEKEKDFPVFSSIPLDTMEVTQDNEGLIEFDEPSQSKQCTKKKLTEFGYLLQRKGFRLMRKYYKEKFEDFGKAYDYKRRVKSITPNELSHMILKFIEFEFAKILPMLTSNEISLLLESLKQIVLSDRSNKKEPMIHGIDFSIVRNLFGKYTQKNMKLFMTDSANSFLYTHFYLINGRYECYKQSDVDQNNLNDQMKRLMLEAFKSLFHSVKPVYEQLYEQNASKL